MRVSLLLSTALLAAASCAPAGSSASRTAAGADDACSSQRVGGRAACASGDSSIAGSGMATYVVENGTSCYAQVTYARTRQDTRTLAMVPPGGRAVFDVPARGRVVAIASNGGERCEGGRRTPRVRRVE
jgi:hypothetical protein